MRNHLIFVCDKSSNVEYVPTFAMRIDGIPLPPACRGNASQNQQRTFSRLEYVPTFATQTNGIPLPLAR